MGHPATSFPLGSTSLDFPILETLRGLVGCEKGLDPPKEWEAREFELIRGLRAGGSALGCPGGDKARHAVLRNVGIEWVGEGNLSFSSTKLISSLRHCMCLLFHFSFEGLFLGMYSTFQMNCACWTSHHIVGPSLWVPI